MSSAFEGLPKTPNLKLNKPGYDNVADIEALNENADILDAEIQGIKNTFVKSVNGINAGDGGNVDLGIIPIAKGGTGQTTASGVRNALGLGNTTGALPIANGGTGADNASSALSNLGILGAIVNASVSGTTITFTKKDNTKITIDTQDTNNGIVAALLKKNGYVKFANGLILQWGVSVTSDTGPVKITYPIAHTIFACPYTTSTMDFNAAAAINTHNNTVKSFYVHARWWIGNEATWAADTFNWFSIGI